MTDISNELEETLEEHQNTRIALNQAFAKFYNDLTGFLNRLNLNPSLKSFCFMNLDQGAMWAREAISILQFNETFNTQNPIVSEKKPIQ